MKAVLQYRASPGLRRKLTALDFPTVVVDENDKDTFRREMREADILLHVLEPVTAAVIPSSVARAMLPETSTALFAASRSKTSSPRPEN